MALNEDWVKWRNLGAIEETVDGVAEDGGPSEDWLCILADLISFSCFFFCCRLLPFILNFV